MSVSKEELIDNLNVDLAWEYTAAVQYIEHGGVLKGAAYMGIKKEGRSCSRGLP